MHIFWKNLFLCMRAGPRALLISTLKSWIIVDEFCTLNRQNISKIDEISINSFRLQIPNLQKFWKNRNPDFSYRNRFRTSCSIWMNLVNFWAMITFHGVNAIPIFVAFHSFYFGAHWVRALEFRARYFPILARNVIFSGGKFREKNV